MQIQKTYILVIDQGTHASRCIVFDACGRQVYCVKKDIHLRRLSAVKIEQDADEILLSVNYCLQKIPFKILSKISVCALTGQRSTFVAWNKHNLKSLSPVLSWQDTRSKNTLEKYAGHKKQIKQITGLPLSAHYGAGKILYLLQQNNIKYQQDILIAPLMSFLLDNILDCAPHIVDHSNAHRSLLFDLHTLDWSPQCLNIFKINQNILPKCKPVKYNYGKLKNSAVPIKLVCGDQGAALFSAGEVDKEAIYINIGTGAFALSIFDHAITNTELLCSLIYSSQTDKKYALEATVNGAGSALSWLSNEYPVDDLFSKLEHWLLDIKSIPIFINSIGGLGSPWWFNTPEKFIGENITRANRYVALIESIVFMLVNNIQLMQQHKKHTKIIVSGGLSKLDGLCQKLSDLSKLEVRRSYETEATARGAAWLISDHGIDWLKLKEDVFKPATDRHLIERFEQFYVEMQRLKQKRLHSSN